MNIKSFKPGQEAYTLLEQEFRGIANEVKKVNVVSVGRKYVTVVPDGGGWAMEFYDNDYKEYLVEKKDWGDKKLLFLSKQDIDDYIEKKKIYCELQKDFQYGYDINDFTLSQLKKINKIINEEQELTEKITSLKHEAMELCEAISRTCKFKASYEYYPIGNSIKFKICDTKKELYITEIALDCVYFFPNEENQALIISCLADLIEKLKELFTETEEK